MLQNPEHILRVRTSIPLPIGRVFEFFATADNLQEITPRHLGFRILTPRPFAMRQGTQIDYALSLFGIPFKWRTEISLWRPPHEFVDVQLRGPYAQWIHHHRFFESDGATVIEDEVRYRLPVPLLGLVALPFVRHQLNQIFKYRQTRIRELLTTG